MQSNRIALGMSAALHVGLLAALFFANHSERKNALARASKLQVHYVAAPEMESAPAPKILTVHTTSHPVKKKKQQVTQSKRKEILQKVTKTLSDLEKNVQKRAMIKPAIAAPVPAPQIMQEPTKEATSLEEKLVLLFASELCLPETGRVWMTLFFDKEGAFIRAESSESESRMNLDYLLEMLPRLCYPPKSDGKEHQYEICFDGSTSY